MIPGKASFALSMKERCIFVSGFEPEAARFKTPIFLFLEKGEKRAELGSLFCEQLIFGNFSSFHA